MQLNIFSNVLIGTAVKSEQCDLLLNGRCYQKKQDLRQWCQWYDARNECLDEGGDLASFEALNGNDFNTSLKNLSLRVHSSDSYWIGLQKNEWRWEDTGLLLRLPVFALLFTQTQIHSMFMYETHLGLCYLLLARDLLTSTMKVFK